MTKKVNSDIKAAVSLIIQENLTAVRDICTHAANFVSKSPKWSKQSKSQKKTKSIKNHERNKKELT